MHEGFEKIFPQYGLEKSLCDLNEMPGSGERLRKKYQFFNFSGKILWGNYVKQAKSQLERRVSNPWNHVRQRGWPYAYKGEERRKIGHKIRPY